MTASSMNSPQWVSDLCAGYAPFLFNVGSLTLIMGVLLGIALAVSAIIIALRTKPTTESTKVETTGTTATAILDAIRGFIQALSSAPTWLALFGGGILLLWLAGNAVPEICKPPATAASKTTTITDKKTVLTKTAPGTVSTTEERTQTNTSN